MQCRGIEVGERVSQIYDHYMIINHYTMISTYDGDDERIVGGASILNGNRGGRASESNI